MAGYRALAAVGLSLVDLLTRRFDDDLPVGDPRPNVVLAGTADFDKLVSPDSQIRLPAVSVYCYRVTLDPETRPGWSAVGSFDGLPRIPLRMHLLITAWDNTAQGELEWLGLAVRVLESEPILTGPLLHPIGAWGPGDVVQVVADELDLDSLSEAFQALTADYRLSLPYLARVVRIDGRREPRAEPVATVAANLARVSP